MLKKIIAILIVVLGAATIAFGLTFTLDYSPVSVKDQNFKYVGTPSSCSWILIKQKEHLGFQSGQKG